MTDVFSPSVSRRQALVALATGVTAATAGCAGLWEQTGATDVTVVNDASGPRTVSITITQSGDSEPHTDRTLDLDAGETVADVNDSKLPTNSDYTIEVAVEGGPSETYEWKDPTVELAPLWIRIDDTANIRFLLEAG